MNISQYFWSDVFSNSVAGLISGLILILFSVFIFDERKVLRPWINNLASPLARHILNSLLMVRLVLFHEYARVTYISAIVLILLFYNQRPNVYYLAAFAILCVLTLLFKSSPGLLRRPRSVFSDTEFSLFEHWQPITGVFTQDATHGKPAPGLLLPRVDGQATNTFLILNGVEMESGIIECDYYLEPEGLLNVVVFCDISEQNWYMARYEARSTEHDGILVKGQGPGANWRHDTTGTSRSSARTWHKARIEFSSEKIVMYRDDELITEITAPNIFGKAIGLFNELNDVHIDNFYLRTK